jgi:mono/diheme cytochrome c family protein
VAIVSIAGFRGGLSRRPPIELFPDMDRQPKLRPQARSLFFANQLSSQLMVPGTIARGAPYQDTPENTGLITGSTNFVENVPVPVTEQLMARGQERYQIHCAPCHGAGGDGKGITTKYGMTIIANLHDLRIVSMADGQIFHTISHGSPSQLMLPYRAHVSIPDRWAIIAYLRALQRSRLASIDEVPESLRSSLKK